MQAQMPPETQIAFRLDVLAGATASPTVDLKR